MGGGSDSFLSMAFQSGFVVGMVLVLLVLASVGCWAVILFKFVTVRRAVKENREFQDIFWECREFGEVLGLTDELRQSPLAEVFREGYAEWRQSDADAPAQHAAGRHARDLITDGSPVENVDRALRRAMDSESERLQSYLIFLATVASAAPFVGLFGTVWGIMESFRDIGLAGTANLAVVAPGISEALIATATGLAAAIPAVVAYNYFNNSIRCVTTEMEAFASEFLNIVSRQSGATANGREP